jgi:hypothetical protein
LKIALAEFKNEIKIFNKNYCIFFEIDI